MTGKNSLIVDHPEVITELLLKHIRKEDQALVVEWLSCGDIRKIPLKESILGVSSRIVHEELGLTFKIGLLLWAWFYPELYETFEGLASKRTQRLGDPNELNPWHWQLFRVKDVLPQDIPLLCKTYMFELDFIKQEAYRKRRLKSLSERAYPQNKVSVGLDDIEFID